MHSGIHCAFWYSLPARHFALFPTVTIVISDVSICIITTPIMISGKASRKVVLLGHHLVSHWPSAYIVGYDWPSAYIVGYECCCYCMMLQFCISLLSLCYITWYQGRLLVSFSFDVSNDLHTVLCTETAIASHVASNFFVRSLTYLLGRPIFNYNDDVIPIVIQDEFTNCIDVPL